jgi:hypothetical protein
MSNVLVHAAGGRQKVTAHKGYLSHLEYTLDSTVLTVLAVEYGEYSIYLYIGIASVIFQLDKAAMYGVGAEYTGSVVGMFRPAAILDILHTSHESYPVTFFGDTYAYDLIAVGIRTDTAYNVSR